nr:uncharacterized protein LOC112732536 [Arachis hypogaea]
MREGESGRERLRVKHGEEDGHTIERDKGESVGGFASGVKEGSSKGDLSSRVTSKISFRDKVIGSTVATGINRAEALDEDSMAVVTGKQGDPMPPRVCFSEEARNILSEPYKEAIVIKVLGKNLSYTAMFHKLKGVWRITGGYEILDVGFGYFLVKFDRMDDREKVLLGGPWMIFGHYIAVKPWTPDFKPCEDTFEETMVWIRISGLSIWYYQDKAMMRIASAVGRPVKVDLATKLAERGKFARACVQINLGLPVVRSVIVDEFEYKVEYECLHLICDKCNCFGHPATDCRMTPIDSERVDRKETSVTETAARVVQPQEASKEKIFEFGCNPKESVIVAEIGEKLDDTLHGKEVGSQHLENEAGRTKVSSKRKGKLSQSNKAQQTSKDKMPVRSNQKLDQNCDFGLRMRGAESGVKTGSVSGSKARMASSKQQGVKGKSVSVVVPTFTAIIKNGHKRLRPSSLQNSPSTPDCLGDTSK